MAIINECSSAVDDNQFQTLNTVKVWRVCNTSCLNFPKIYRSNTKCRNNRKSASSLGIQIFWLRPINYLIIAILKYGSSIILEQFLYRVSCFLVSYERGTKEKLLFCIYISEGERNTWVATKFLHSAKLFSKLVCFRNGLFKSSW